MFSFFHAYENHESYEQYYRESASRIGTRIRKIRFEKGLSQIELGNILGLTADRVQKYENGARKPKLDMVYRIAKALDVSPYAIMEPVLGDYCGIMNILFSLEEDSIIQIEKNTDVNRLQFTITGDSKDPLYNAVKLWFEKIKSMENDLSQATSDKEKEDIILGYKNWKWNFPNSLPYESAVAEQKKEDLRRRIEELQEEYDKICND